MSFPHKRCTTVVLFFVSVAIAHIPFHWVQPGCKLPSRGRNECLRGQECGENGRCHFKADRSALATRGYSTDGRCGPAFNNTECDPASTNYHGSCCSQYGWCGDSDAHCLTGCISGCQPVNTCVAAVSTILNQDVNPRPALGEPTLAQTASATTISLSVETSGPVTTDGSCGAAAGDAVCGDWYKGSCCSMYGFCGNTTAHCGDGCQSGPCLNGQSIAVPGPEAAPPAPAPGSFVVVGQSGVPAMHAALMENGRVVFLDKVEDYTQLNLSDGHFAYSAEYDPATNQAVPLAYQTNAFCSGGIFLRDGRLLNVGGNAPLPFVDPTVGNGFTAIRYLNRSSTNASLDGLDWSEPGNKLSSARWYPSAQIMPDGTVFVASGSLNGLDPSVASNNNPTYEVLDPLGISSGQSVVMGILETNQPYYMYPFVHLLPNGSLFVFVSKSAELFDLASNASVKTFPDLPGDYRTYPNTGGSVLLPLSSANGWQPEIVICGGGPYQDLSAPTDASCGRIQPLSDTAEWELDSMPEGRVMVEAILLPDSTVVWLNGCSQGAQGFGLGAVPAYDALIYDPSQALGQRFTAGANSTIARMYHSVALLLLDGTIMVAGSNPVAQPILVPDAQNPFVTEFRVEIYTPPYLSGDSINRRPTNISLSGTNFTADGSTFNVSFIVPKGALGARVVLYYGGFVTHSLHMGHRMAVLDTQGWMQGATQQMMIVAMPPNSSIAPPGPWVVYVLCDGVPGIGQFVSVS